MWSALTVKGKRAVLGAVIAGIRRSLCEFK